MSQATPPQGQATALQDVESRVTELEIKSAFSEDLVEELNRTVYRQQQQIEQLQLELAALRRQVQTLQPASPGSPGDERPPHY